MFVTNYPFILMFISAVIFSLAGYMGSVSSMKMVIKLK